VVLDFWITGTIQRMWRLKNPKKKETSDSPSSSPTAPSVDSAVMGSGQTHFTYEELEDITEGFSKQNILGEGGFGCVYKGKLKDGKLVAVKQLKVGSGQGDREFKAEVEIISRVHHRHLVSLVGYCIADSERLLIYEYVPNQTLEHHLHGETLLPLFSLDKIFLTCFFLLTLVMFLDREG